MEKRKGAKEKAMLTSLGASVNFSQPLTRGKTDLKSLVVHESRNELSAGKELENGTKNVIQ